MIRFTLSQGLIAIVLAAVAANALGVVGREGAPAVVYSFAAAVAACCLLRRQRPTVRALAVVGAAAFGAQFGALDLPSNTTGVTLVLHGMLIGALVAVIGVRQWPSRSVPRVEPTLRSAALPLRVGAISAGMAALLALLVFWYDVSEQQATLLEGMETAGRVLIIGLFVTGLAVAITLVVGRGKNNA
jgi:hypothetical protein